MLYLRYDFGAVVVLSPLILPEYEALAACRGLSGAKRVSIPRPTLRIYPARRRFPYILPECEALALLIEPAECETLARSTLQARISK